LGRDKNTEAKKSYHGTIGKYLFFSENREKLLKLGKKILKENNLSFAKISNKPRDKSYVLCVYDYEPRFKYEFKKYETKECHYRYWKSDEQTIKEHSS